MTTEKCPVCGQWVWEGTVGEGVLVPKGLLRRVADSLEGYAASIGEVGARPVEEEARAVRACLEGRS